MYSAWTKHIKDGKEKEDFKKAIYRARHVLNRLKALLDEEEAGLNRSEMDIKSFDLPNWDYKQAYKNGYRACLNQLFKLVDLDQQKEIS